MEMAIALPTWLLWCLGVPVYAVVLFLLAFGATLVWHDRHTLFQHHGVNAI